MLGPLLLCDNDPALLSTREMVLTHAGFTASICSENDIAAMPQNPAIALAVMGHSTLPKEQAAAAELVRAKWPDSKILFLRNSDRNLEQQSNFEYECGSLNPARLIRACRLILDSSSASD